MVGDYGARGEGGKAHDGADRQIDIAGQDHQSLPGGDQCHDGDRRRNPVEQPSVEIALNLRGEEKQHNGKHREQRHNAQSSGGKAGNQAHQAASFCPVASAIMDSWLAFSWCNDRHLTALAHHQNTVAKGENFRKIRGNHQSRAARCGESADQGVDLGLGTDVDSTGGLIDDQQVRCHVQPFRQHHLLLIAARQIAHGNVGVRRANVQLFLVIPSSCNLGPGVDQPPGR